MDSVMAIGLLNADLLEQTNLLATYTTSAEQAQKKIDVINIALSVLQNGYQTDQARIDADVQTAKDNVAAQIADLTTKLDTANATIATLQSVEITP